VFVLFYRICPKNRVKTPNYQSYEDSKLEEAHIQPTFFFNEVLSLSSLVTLPILCSNCNLLIPIPIDAACVAL
jgi:hypothetical protein